VVEWQPVADKDSRGEGVVDAIVEMKGRQTRRLEID